MADGGGKPSAKPKRKNKFLSIQSEISVLKDSMASQQVVFQEAIDSMTKTIATLVPSQNPPVGNGDTDPAAQDSNNEIDAEGLSVSDTFNDLLGVDNGKDENNDEITPEILEILNDQDKDDSLGPGLCTAVASRMLGIVEQKTTKEGLEKIKARLLTPDNCKFLGVPKINPELWTQLSPKIKSTDAKMQYIQQFGAKSLTAFALLTNEIAKSAKLIPKELSENLLKICLDGAAAAAMQHRESSLNRMQAIKPLLSAQFSGICATPSTTSSYLFGDNFQDVLKTSKTMTNIMKRGTGNRYMPYTIPRTTGNLNFRGQRRFHYRGGIRGRPMYNRNRFQSNPRQ